MSADVNAQLSFCSASLCARYTMSSLSFPSEKVSQSPFGHIVWDYPPTAEYNAIQITERQKYKPSVGDD